MDLKIYFQKIHDLEAKIVDAFPVVVSHEHSDGGKAGVLTEVTRAIAAKLIVEGMARLATIEESKRFQELKAEAKRLADQAMAAAKVQLSVLTSTELEKLRGLTGKKQG
jgi:hypothetical protein